MLLVRRIHNIILISITEMKFIMKSLIYRKINFLTRFSLRFKKESEDNEVNKDEILNLN